MGYSSKLPHRVKKKVPVQVQNSAWTWRLVISYVIVCVCVGGVLYWQTLGLLEHHNLPQYCCLACPSFYVNCVCLLLAASIWITQFKLCEHKNEFTALKQPPQSLDFNPLTTNRRFNHKHNLDVNMDQNVSLMLMFEVQPSTSNKLFNPFFVEGGTCYLK